MSILVFPDQSVGQEWKDVAPIFYKNCSPCHRSGEIGPFPIMSYHDLTHDGGATLWSCLVQINSGKMPPWKADPSYVHFLDERILTSAEKQAINDWVNAGWPAGDTTLAPPPPTFAAGSQLGTPDLVLSMKQSYALPGDGLDRYVCFVLPTDLPADTYIKGIEFRPGNRAAVHHVFLYVCDDSSAYYADLATPEYGYPSFGGAGQDVNATFLGLYGPGMIPRLYPSNGAILMKKNSFFIIQMHYAPLTYAASDSSSVNLFFYNSPVTPRKITAKRVGEGYITNPPFTIFPETVDTFYSTFPIPKDKSLFAIAPHQHLLGKSFKIWAITPQGDTLPLIHVPQWDFNWQLLYHYPFMIKLPQGTNVIAQAVYDNTSLNPNNPNNPPKKVTYGESSEDEMFKYLLMYMDYEPGDETLVLDSSWVPVNVSESSANALQWMHVFPNPTDGAVKMRLYLNQAASLTFLLVDFMGRPVWRHQQTAGAGWQQIALQLADVAEGCWLLVVDDGHRRRINKIVIAKSP
ncbi:MAG: hypothetical protein RMK52_07135 [Chitinophagales bacterium]|nr:hypothetical protein [Chitinophagales bacterium]MDW8394004.1 hypothetical protein [Chitinophagales bacterium]